MTYLVISTSLNPNSQSYILALEAVKRLQQYGTVDFVDLRKLKLPHCDGDKSLSHRNVQRLAARIEKARCVILAVPIYNYDVGSVVKNMVELTGDAWQEKTVGFLSAAGGKSSFMAVGGLALSLIFDFRCLLIPNFVYADRSSFQSGVLVDKRALARMDDLVDSARRLAGMGVSGRPSPRAAALAVMAAMAESEPKAS
ncbi:MAG: NAD(P)H-dependent oxidoreductase [Candidatus Obscuribacterales bacterium]|nr:NAD(P)H-dependent oxidoreductase [Candidatus Obscuribacterales bacterium]